MLAGGWKGAERSELGGGVGIQICFAGPLEHQKFSEDMGRTSENEQPRIQLRPPERHPGPCLTKREAGAGAGHRKHQEPGTFLWRVAPWTLPQMASVGPRGLESRMLFRLTSPRKRIPMGPLGFSLATGMCFFVLSPSVCFCSSLGLQETKPFATMPRARCLVAEYCLGMGEAPEADLSRTPREAYVRAVEARVFSISRFPMSVCPLLRVPFLLPFYRTPKGHR